MSVNLEAVRPPEPSQPPGDGCPDAWHGVQPQDPFLRGDPYPALRHLREADPVNETPLGYVRLSRYHDVVRLLREVPTGVRHADGVLPGRREDPTNGPGQFMLQQDPPAHTRLRKLVSKAFTPRATELWRPRAEAIADECIDRVLARNPGRASGEMDVIADLALPVPSTLICEMMGVPLGDRDRFTAWTGDATQLLAGDMVPAPVRERAILAARSLAEYFDALIARRRSSLTDDLLSELIRAEEEGDKLTPTELLVQNIGLLIAGFETTIGLIGNGVRALLRHPAELARLRAEPSLLPSAVEECLRFDGPIGATIRVLREDTEFGGKRIAADTEVLAMLGAANRDPARFPDPDRFDVGRGDNAHLAFGGGTHMCLGAHLARMEAQAAIGTLVRRLPELRLASEQVEWGRSLFRVPARLPVLWGLTPR